MSISLNHTIVHCTDKAASSRHLVEILDLPEPTTYGPFVVVQIDNDVSLDYADDHGTPHPQHYAFLVDDASFEPIRQRIVARGLTYWADPFHRVEGEINTNDGGKGLYWLDPDGHSMEIITVPYGGG
ncbi:MULTISPECIES: VOC family protein [unclassified Nocardioides]|uniref:VOC family protein n=1 Tax=unclassified Nocardioides TaxID=2615069 RepID=UPI0006F9F65E|nr:MULTISPECIES: VOC family protein [unclassified Nocardioides]KQY62647.1 bleomycin resistance protein [Nocardioides sp. Root140]KRF15024.1 bleomycin resistance protein [Nocardioides sp. Soil796]